MANTAAIPAVTTNVPVRRSDGRAPEPPGGPGAMGVRATMRRARGDRCGHWRLTIAKAIPMPAKDAATTSERARSQPMSCT